VLNVLHCSITDASIDKMLCMPQSIYVCAEGKQFSQMLYDYTSICVGTGNRI